MNKLSVVVALALAACTPSQLGQVQDASSKRKIVCEFIKSADGIPEAKAACDAGQDLEAIAAAYAGCTP